MSVHIDVADILRKAGIATGATMSSNEPVAARPLRQAVATGSTRATAGKHGDRHGTAKAHPTETGEHHALRRELAALAGRMNIAAERLERVDDEWLALLARMPADSLPAYLLALDDMATRQAGEIPADDTAAICCAGCGPVYAHPSIAAVLPIVNGWPRVLGCPWCAIRKAGGRLPRPDIASADCASFIPKPGVEP